MPTTYTPSQMAGAINSMEPTISLQDKTVSPKIGQQTVSAGAGYDGLGTVTVNSIPASPITLMIPNWVSGASITYNGTVYNSGQAIQMYATEKILLTMPTTGATLVVNGTYFTMQTTTAEIVIFANAVINMGGTNPYRVDCATLDGVGGRVPVQYIFKTWEAYAYCMANISGFTFSDILILDYSDSIVIGFLKSNFAVQSYDDSTGAFTASGWYRCSYAKSTGVWTFSNYASTTSPSGDTLAKAVFTDGTLTYSSSTVFPTNKKAGGGGGGPWTIDLADCYNASATYNNTVYTNTTFTVPDGAFVVFTLEQGPTTGDSLDIYLNNVLVARGGTSGGYPTYSMLVHSDVAVAEGSWNETYITAQ